MDNEFEEFEEKEEIYPLEELVEEDDLEYLRSMHPSKVPLYISKWIAREKREQALKECPPTPYEEEPMTPMALAKVVQKSQKMIAKGNFSEVEAHLIAQSTALERIFRIFTERMINEKYYAAQGTYGSIALKAQNQARKTLLTLSELKNPKKLTFIKQQNNAQINVNQEKNSKQTFEEQTS